MNFPFCKCTDDETYCIDLKSYSNIIGLSQHGGSVFQLFIYTNSRYKYKFCKMKTHIDSKFNRKLCSNS